MTDGLKSVTPIILASGSKVRATLLAGAGVTFSVQTSPVDEDAAKVAHGGSGLELALYLAEVKGRPVSEAHPDALVISADQVLTCEGRHFDKPATLSEAAQNLRFLAGRTHTLHGAVCVSRGGNLQWSHTDEAHLTMRAFSETFLDAYLTACGEDVLTSVGCYQLEGRGVQLFDDIRGTYFTILGLPLLPLLAHLRSQGVLAQ